MCMLCVLPSHPPPSQQTNYTLQETLNSNYEGTRTVLELAAASQQLRGLVHVSSAFVNMNMPRGSIIDEAVYPLRLGNQVVDVEQLAKVCLGLVWAWGWRGCKEEEGGRGKGEGRGGLSLCV